MERLLILNPGSTSTKLAVFEGEEPLFVESITHSAEELAPYDCVADQYSFRRDLVLDCLKRHGIALESITGIVSRGGLLTAIEAGAYAVNEDMVWQLKNKPRNEHASNVGAMIAKAIADQLNIPAFIYDGVTVEELLPINKITGLASMQRKGMGHCLNVGVAERLKALILADYPEADIFIEPTTALCSFYAEKDGIIVGFEDMGV